MLGTCFSPAATPRSVAFVRLLGVRDHLGWPSRKLWPSAVDRGHRCGMTRDCHPHHSCKHTWSARCLAHKLCLLRPCRLRGCWAECARSLMALATTTASSYKASKGPSGEEKQKNPSWSVHSWGTRSSGRSCSRTLKMHRLVRETDAFHGEACALNGASNSSVLEGSGRGSKRVRLSGLPSVPKTVWSHTARGAPRTPGGTRKKMDGTSEYLASNDLRGRFVFFYCCSSAPVQSWTRFLGLLSLKSFCHKFRPLCQFGVPHSLIHKTVR